jgi:hypothetical protein
MSRVRVSFAELRPRKPKVCFSKPGAGMCGKDQEDGDKVTEQQTPTQGNLTALEFLNTFSTQHSRIPAKPAETATHLLAEDPGS